MAEREDQIKSAKEMFRKNVQIQEATDMAREFTVKKETILEESER